MEHDEMVHRIAAALDENTGYIEICASVGAYQRPGRISSIMPDLSFKHAIFNYELQLVEVCSAHCDFEEQANRLELFRPYCGSLLLVVEDASTYDQMQSYTSHLYTMTLEDYLQTKVS